MKLHSEDYKEEIKNLGRQQDVIITYTINNEEHILRAEDINSVTPHYNANLLKSVMKQLDIDSNIEIPVGTEINFKHGLLVNGVFEYLDYGNYIVYSVEKQEDSNSYNILCYDKMLYSMKDYEPLNLTYPTTLATYLINLCQRLGYTLRTVEFANMDKQLPRDVFDEIEFTYRDVLDDIAEATGSTIYINLNDELVLGQPNETNDTIDEEYLKDVNVKFGEKYGPINTLILSRSAGADNIYYPSYVPESERVALRIEDNQIMNQNNRDTYMQEIFNNINGIEYYLNDFTSTGILYYDLLDFYNVQIGENTYKCLMLNDEADITQGIEEQIYTEMPETAETDYTKADKTDRKINQTTLIVNKQNQNIEALITSNTELVNKTSQLKIEVDNIKGEIGEIADVTTTVEGHGIIQANNVNESEPILLRIYPDGEDITPLYPRDDLYPSDNLFPHNRELYIIRINEMESEEHYELKYNLPCDLYRLDNIHDEFVLDYENLKCYVIHRIGVSEEGEKYLLEIAHQEEFEYPELHLLDGDYIITTKAFENAYIYVRLMAKNLYTSQFATKIELNSKIDQTKNKIEEGVSETLEGYSTTQEINTKIVQEIQNNNNAYVNIELNKKVDNDDYTSAQILLKINKDTSSAKIKADKIDLERKANKFNIR